MSPKPVSIQRRFLLLQSLTLLISAWLVGAAVYVVYASDREFEQPLAHLHAALASDQQLQVAIEEVMRSALYAHDHPPMTPEASFREAKEQIRQSLAAYRELELPANELRALERIEELQSEMLASALRLYETRGSTPAAEGTLEGVRRLSAEIQEVLRRMTALRLARMDEATDQLARHRWTLLGLLGSYGLFGLVMTWQFKRLHRRGLWEPLERYREGMLKARRGNLDVQFEVPDNVELRSLVQTSQETLNELRKIKETLEQEAAERTASLDAEQHQLLRAATFSALGQVVAGVSHEINNPLTIILGFSEVLLARPELEPRMRSHLQTIREESLRVRTLVANLAAFAQMGPQQMSRIDLRTVTDRLVRLRKDPQRANNIALHYLRPEAPVWVQADGDQLLLALFNVVLNGEQALRPALSAANGLRRNACGGHLWLELSEERNRACVTVRDDGAGMSEEVQAHLFDPLFFTRPTGEGRGLGLSVALGIIRRHGGQLAVESAAGKGTTVRVTLPLDAPGSGREPEPARPESKRKGEPEVRAALVVDDEPSISALVEEALAQEGWQSTVINDSTQVQAVLDRHRFGLVVCDLKMPGLDGLGVLRAVRRTDPALAARFILMTANIADADAHRAELAGVPILTKPFSLAQLRAAVRQVLRR